MVDSSILEKLRHVSQQYNQKKKLFQRDSYYGLSQETVSFTQSTKAPSHKPTVDTYESSTQVERITSRHVSTNTIYCKNTSSISFLEHVTILPEPNSDLQDILHKLEIITRRPILCEVATEIHEPDLEEEEDEMMLLSFLFDQDPDELQEAPRIVKEISLPITSRYEDADISTVKLQRVSKPRVKTSLQVSSKSSGKKRTAKVAASRVTEPTRRSERLIINNSQAQEQNESLLKRIRFC